MLKNKMQIILYIHNWVIGKTKALNYYKIAAPVKRKVYNTSLCSILLLSQGTTNRYDNAITGVSIL